MNRKSLSYRLIKSILLITILPGFIIYSLGYVSLGKLLRDNAEKHLALITNNLANNVQNWDRRTSLSLLNLSRLPEIKSMQAQKQLPALKITAKTYSYYLVNTVSFNGIDIARQDGKKLRNYSDRKWFLGAKSGKRITRQALMSRSTGKPALAYSTAIQNENKKIIGVVVAATFLSGISKMIGATRIAKTGFAYCVNEEGKVLAHPNLTITKNTKKLIDLKNYPPVKKALTLNASEGTNFQFTKNDKTWLSYIVHLENGWSVIIQQEEKEVLAQANNLQFTGLIIFIIATFVMIFLIWLITHRFVKPIKNMLTPIRKMGQGDWSQRVTVETADEVGELGSTFNHMAKQLEELFASLEYKVKERTKELQEVNAQISKSIDFASLIQQTFIFKNEILNHFFDDNFVILKQRETVGGDIVLFEKINNEEALLMLIDCTSHGVPGAFVSMIVKTLQSQMIKEIREKKIKPDPAELLQRFNYEIKNLLGQTSVSSKSNVGFDGQILYYNKRKKEIKFSSARNDIIIIENNKLKRIRGDRHSVGYKDSDKNFPFTEYTLFIKKSISIYLYSDGFTDQLGGNSNLPFGNKRTLALLEECNEFSMDKQADYLMQSINDYRNGLEQNDDISFVGLKLEG